MRRVVLTFGLLSGAVLSLMLLITALFRTQIGFDKGAVIGYTTMVAAFLMVYFGIRSYRDNVLRGPIGFGKAFQVGLLITVIASACYVATWEFVFYKLTPDFADKYAAAQMEQARASGATAEQLATQAQQMAKFKEMYSNPIVNVALTFLEPLPVALVMTLVCAGILSRGRGGVGGQVVGEPTTS
ncbi:MAG: DUF4199 domain-containing protein [Gemmatimonadaceae bacterium]